MLVGLLISSLVNSTINSLRLVLWTRDGAR